VSEGWHGGPDGAAAAGAAAAIAIEVDTAARTSGTVRIGEFLSRMAVLSFAASNPRHSGGDPPLFWGITPWKVDAYFVVNSGDQTAFRSIWCEIKRNPH
jgi:hypothetical protein